MTRTSDEEKRVKWLLDWIVRMAAKHDSGIVYDKSGKHWDWGQALCRECYGENWSDNPDLPEVPTWEDIRRAQRWEDGDVPSWVVEIGGNE